jgi:threonine synthase
VTTLYDLDAAAHVFDTESLAARPWGPMRYEELLPPGAGRVALAGGPTPLLPLDRLAARLGLRALWLKDESRNATWSFKDRAAVTAAGSALDDGAAGLVVSSTGNAAAATAAFAASAGLPAVVLVAAGVDPVMAAFVSGYDVRMFAAPTKVDRWTLMRHCVERLGFYPNSNYTDPPVGNDPRAVDGYKMIAYEMWEQLGRRAPAVVAMPVGYGDALHALVEAFGELAMITGSERPRMVCGEVYGSLAAALRSGHDAVDRVAVDRATVASSIGTAQSTYRALRAMRRSQGHVTQVDDDAIIAAQRLLVRDEGVLAEAASAAGLAGLQAAVASGAIGVDDEVVLLNTSAGVKSVSALGHLGRRPPEVAGTDDLERALAESLPSLGGTR